MPRHGFAILLTALFAAASVFGSPVAVNETTSLEARGTTYTGRGTWYYVGLGACGYTDVDTDYIVAISYEIYGSGGNCNQYMSITNTANGEVAYGKTRDKCTGCVATAIDVSPSLFEALGADLDEGDITVSWHFMSTDWSP